MNKENTSIIPIGFQDLYFQIINSKYLNLESFDLFPHFKVKEYRSFSHTPTSFYKKISRIY
jgi:hypothetical protein